MNDTDIKLRQCVRCDGYVLACTEGGQPAAVDPAPLDTDAYRRALMAGRRTYRLLRSPTGKPWRLQADSPRVPSALDRLAAHGCRNAPLRPVDSPVADHPRSAPATPGDGPAGDLRPAARASSSAQGLRSAAGHAIPRRSDQGIRPYLARRCEVCGEIIGTSAVIGMQQGEYWIWCMHDACARP